MMLVVMDLGCIMFGFIVIRLVQFLTRKGGYKFIK